MITNKTQKNAFKYECILCDYKSSNKTDYSRHLLTDKHKRLQNNDKCDLFIKYICDCGKTYKYRQGLYTHRKTCKGEKKENVIITNEKDNIDYKAMFFEMVKKNNEFQDLLLKQSEQISEMIPNIGNNNTNNSNNKNKFNINVFLNEKCKDALSMEEFIDKIEISMKNLLTTKEKGQVHGISNIIIENMNKLSLYERPLHCTDKKRETLYVKNDTWEKDENKQHINKALKDVERKQMQNINVWLEEHPNYMNNSQQQEEFANLISECGKSVDDGREKIIKNVCDNVFLEKEDCKGL